MYSTTEATIPEMGPPATVALFIDMFRPHCLIHSASLAQLTLI
jgi:hypothetical protein